jgi:hypothetical protein
VQRAEVDRAGHRPQPGPIDALALMGLQVANAGEDDVALVQRSEAWDRLAQRPPARAREDRQAHDVGEARQVVVGRVEVGMGVEPHGTEPLRARAGRGAQPAHAVAAQHEREGAIRPRRADAMGEAADELEDPRDLGLRLVDRWHASDVQHPAGRGQRRAEAVVPGQSGRAETHPDVAQPCVVRPRDQRERRVGLGCHGATA